MTITAPKFIARARGWFRPAANIAAAPVVTGSVRGANQMPLDSSAILARYESGQFGGYDRSWLPGYVQDARQDITPGERIEMVRKGRYFERNSGTMQKSLDLIETNVVGTGVHASFASSDAKWNERAQIWWDEWCQYADISSRQTFETLQALMVRAQAVDGEIFVWLTEGEPDQQGRRYPRIQLIETHRVCDAKLPVQYAKEGYTQFDGILSDARGRPAFYIVTNDADAFSKAMPANVALIPADKMVHVYEPSRTSQPRGITLYHACLHDLHDLDDLQRYEMLASKDAAERANVVKTENGELPDDGTLIGRKEQVLNSDGTMGERITYYRTAFGSKTVVMKHGDSWEQGEALRPTSAQQEFWKILERKFCRGAGHSYAALCDYEGSWGGAALRATLASDNRFYDVRTKTLVGALQRIRDYVIGTQVRPGGALDGAPKDWKKTAWQSPRRATVDIGRESTAILNELRVGVRNFRDILGELGLDWKEALRQRMIEQKFIMDTAKELEIPAGLVLSMIGAANNTNVFGEKAAAAVETATGVAEDALPPDPATANQPTHAP